MSVKRKQYKPELKATVALAAIRGDETTTHLFPVAFIDFFLLF